MLHAAPSSGLDEVVADCHIFTTLVTIKTNLLIGVCGH